MPRPFKLRAGIFLAPFHPLDEDPTEALHRDLDLVEFLDHLGFDEAWIGEHHSGGFEIIASPELFIAAAAVRTRRIKLGTGVVSLPYHHPLMVADRIIQLDHMTRGRVMFGVGPGLLPSDAFMLGIEVSQQRDRMMQALDVILRLMKGEVVTEKTEWYEPRKILGEQGEKESSRSLEKLLFSFSPCSVLSQSSLARILAPWRLGGSPLQGVSGAAWAVWTAACAFFERRRSATT